MAVDEVHVVTGAFGYTGRYITRRLLARGITVKTLTGHPDRPNPFGDQVSAMPFNFDKPAELTKSLEGASVLYNTYWVRFSHGQNTHERAVANTQTLIRAAEEAGVKRMVHVSIAKPSLDSTLPYYRGKAIMEQTLRESKLSYAILRPTVLFGVEAGEDVLINNIAWLLRRFPAFAIPGAGGYKLQPIYVEDLADLAVSVGQQSENVVINAVGPEIFTFDELVRLVAKAVNSRAWIVHVPPGLALALAQLISLLVGDVMLTGDEVAGLMGDLLFVDSPPPGQKRLSEWLAQNAKEVGARYASELGRHFK
ncbi:MAG: NAD(P)H-binding protein [Chloroflexi bacterium]|nr:NAD(P)H-binding protein [Chloroflexota bacterium]